MLYISLHSCFVVMNHEQYINIGTTPPPQLPSPPFFCIIHTCIFSYSFMIRIFFIPIGDYKWNCRPSRRRLWSKWRRNRRERCFHAPIRSPNSNIRRRFRSVRWWNKGNVAHLPRRILRSETVMTCNITHTSSPNTAPSKKSKKKKTRNWKRVKPSFSIPQPQEPDDTEEEVQVERFMKKKTRQDENLDARSTPRLQFTHGWRWLIWPVLSQLPVFYQNKEVVASIPMGSRCFSLKSMASLPKK